MRVVDFNYNALSHVLCPIDLDTKNGFPGEAGASLTTPSQAESTLDRLTGQVALSDTDVLVFGFWGFPNHISPSVVSRRSGHAHVQD